MAFPKQSLLGVRVAIPKQHVRKVRKELLKRVCPLPGEAVQELARRASLALGAMGLRAEPVRSQEKLPAPSGECNMNQPQSSNVAPATRRKDATAILKIAVMKQLFGEKKLNQSTPSAIGEKKPTQIYQTPPLMVQQSSQPTHNIAPILGAISPGRAAPWTLEGEEGAGFLAQKKLGSGSFGQVFGGFFGPSEKPVAVKVIKRIPMQIRPHKSYVDNEIQALTNLKHPCIVALFGVVHTIFNVQLFLQQHEMSLHQYLAQRPSEAQAKQVSICILKGLAHMHAAGYVHRDLKPGNILVDQQPLAAVIADLGAAHLGETARDKPTTLFVRAPEVMCGYPYLKASDVWSLGCIIAQVEQRRFFDRLHIEAQLFSGRAAEFIFMRALAMKICPKRSRLLAEVRSLGCKQQGLSKQVLTLDHLEGGVLGTRFGHSTFQLFMESLMHFKSSKRAAAEDLLGHPWLQTQEELR